VRLVPRAHAARAPTSVDRKIYMWKTLAGRCRTGRQSAWLVWPAWETQGRGVRTSLSVVRFVSRWARFLIYSCIYRHCKASSCETQAAHWICTPPSKDPHKIKQQSQRRLTL
jgi:hypothetical protein